jgi:metacaspase-1
MEKKALLVGLNRYPDPANALRGCLNDVAQVRSLVQSRLGFRDQDIVTLKDSAATTAAIVQQLHWLVDESRSGDVLVFHYSGHGSQVDDIHGDETDDALDEIICPYDLDWDHPFTDDDLYRIVKNLHPEAGLTVILDCCHSGTGLRAPATNGTRRARFVRPPAATAEGQARAMRRFGAKVVRCGAVLLAACRSDQVAADASIASDYHGAFTYYLCQALEESGCSGSYVDLHHRVRQSLAQNRYEQVPQLEGPSQMLHRPVFSSPVEPCIG